MAIINFETDVIHDQMVIDLEIHPDPMTHPRRTEPVKKITTMISFFTTIVSIICLFFREIYKRRWINKYINSESHDPSHINFMYDEVINDQKSKFGKDRKLINKSFIIDFIILAVSPIPNYDKYITLNCNGMDMQVTFLLSDFFFAFMFLRLIQFFRTSFSYSIYTDPLARRVCKHYGFNASFNFAVQSKLLIDPFKTVLVMFFGTVLIFAYLVRIFELPYLLKSGDDTSFVNIFNAMWFTVVTLTTIGYGDVSPGTIPGKFVTILLAFWGAIFIALLVSIVSNIFNLNNSQQLALRKIRLTRQAAAAISTSIRYFRIKKDLAMLQYQL